jgi:hypothetical protein
MFNNINFLWIFGVQKMISYIKLIGPPILKAIKALEKVAIKMPQVCIMNTHIATAAGFPAGMDSQMSGGLFLDDLTLRMNYFGGEDAISKERCDTIISKSGESLGEYDFYFEWFQKPTIDELNSLIEKIDKALAKIGVQYTITTK